MKKVLQETIITHLTAIINKSFLKKLETISTAEQGIFDQKKY
jgi:hypothetical protein